MKKILELIGVPVFIIIVGKIINDFKIEFMSVIYQKIILELWYVWTGLLIGAIYWFIKFLINLHNSVKNKVSFEEAVIKITKAVNEKLDENRKYISSMIEKIQDTGLKMPSLMQEQIEIYGRQVENLIKAMDAYAGNWDSLTKYMDSLDKRIRILEKAGLPKGLEG